MKPITTSLPDELTETLTRECRRRKVPKAEIAREAIEASFSREAGQVRDVPFTALGRSGYRTTAQDIEEILATAN